MQFLSLGQTDLDFDESFFVKPDFQGDKRVPFVLQLIDKLLDLAFTQEQLAFAHGRMVGVVAVFVFGDVKVAQPDFILVDGAEAVIEAGFSAAQGFDLRSGQYHAGIVFVLDEVFVECGTVPDLHAQNGLVG